MASRQASLPMSLLSLLMQDPEEEGDPAVAEARKDRVARGGPATTGRTRKRKMTRDRDDGDVSAGGDGQGAPAAGVAAMTLMDLEILLTAGRALPRGDGESPPLIETKFRRS